MYIRHKGEKRRGTQKSTPSPHLQLGHSTKSNKDSELTPKCTLTHSKNMYIEDRKIVWSIKSEVKGNLVNAIGKWESRDYALFAVPNYLVEEALLIVPSVVNLSPDFCFQVASSKAKKSFK